MTQTYLDPEPITNQCPLLGEGNESDIKTVLIEDGVSNNHPSSPLSDIISNNEAYQKNNPPLIKTIITFLIRASIATYISTTLFRLLHDGQDRYFIHDENELSTGYKQLEILSYRTVCLNITVYLSAIPEHCLHLLSLISSYCFKKRSEVDVIDDIELLKRKQHEQYKTNKQLAESKMLVLMFVYSIFAPTILSTLNKEDTFYPVSTAKQYSLTSSAKSYRIEWMQYYRWGSEKTTASAYNIAYPASILWIIMLLAKTVIDCTITATEHYIDLKKILQRPSILSLLSSYQQAIAVTYLSIIPLFSLWLLTKTSHGSLLSYYWVMEDEKFRKNDAGNFEPLCHEINNFTDRKLDQTPFVFNRTLLSNYTLNIIEPASLYSFNCLPSLMGDVIIKAPWEFIISYHNHPIAACKSDSFTPWEICNLPSKLPLLEFFILYPIAISLFCLFSISARCCNREATPLKKLVSQILKQTTHDIYNWVEDWHFFTIVLIALIYIFLSNNFGASPAINGALELLGIWHKNSREDFGKLIISFINAWTGSIIVLGGVASHSTYCQLKKVFNSRCSLFNHPQMAEQKNEDSPDNQGSMLISSDTRNIIDNNALTYILSLTHNNHSTPPIPHRGTNTQPSLT